MAGVQRMPTEGVAAELSFADWPGVGTADRARARHLLDAADARGTRTRALSRAPRRGVRSPWPRTGLADGPLRHRRATRDDLWRAIDALGLEAPAARRPLARRLRRRGRRGHATGRRLGARAARRRRLVARAGARGARARDLRRRSRAARPPLRRRRELRRGPRDRADAGGAARARLRARRSGRSARAGDAGRGLRRGRRVDRRRHAAQRPAGRRRLSDPR